jgi:hypothetical protein
MFQDLNLRYAHDKGGKYDDVNDDDDDHVCQRAFRKQNLLVFKMSQL